MINNGRSRHGIDNAIQLDGERIEQEWKPAWKRVKTVLTGTKHYENRNVPV